MTIDCPGEINISSGIESTLLDVRRSIEKALGREIKIKEMPGKLGEQRRSCLSYGRAKDVLGWEPKINLEEGISRTIAWTKNIK
jgi:UDP-glucose 4-epimerase